MWTLGGNYRFDNPRAVQLRLKPFDFEALVSVGLKVCNIFADGASNPQRILSVVNADLIQRVAKAVSGKLGGKVGVAPRIFLKKLVGDLLDRIDQFPDFDPERDFSLNLAQSELTEIERSAQAGISVDDIDLKL
jgi:hypothetical protein